MANTYTSLHYHIVFSTKNRDRLIAPEIEQRVWAYLGGIAKENKMKPLQIGGVEDHVHLLVGERAGGENLAVGVSRCGAHVTRPRINMQIVSCRRCSRTSATSACFVIPADIRALC